MRNVIISILLLTCSIAKSEPLKVGVTAPLTGELAEYGAAVRNGIKLAISEDAKSFDNFQFIFEDNQYSSAKAISAFNKLRTTDRADLIYSWGEPPLHGIAPLAEREKLPVVAMSLDPAPSIGRRYIVRSINYAEQFSQATLAYLRKKGYKRLGLVYSEDPFLHSVIEGLRKNLNSDESVEIIYSYLPNDMDFRTSIAKARVKNYDAIGVYLMSGQVSMFFKQAGLQNFRPPTFGTDYFESETEISRSGGNMFGAVYPHIHVPQQFKERYRDRYGDDIQIAYAFNAYIVAKTLRQRFNDLSGGISGEEIIAELLRTPASNEALPFQVTKNSPEGGNYYRFQVVMKEITENGIKSLSDNPNT